MSQSLAALFREPTPAIALRGVHFDLKGTPPTAERLIQLLETFAAMRYNAVLMEWEDSFPWTVDPRFRSETAYSPEVIQQFRDKAAQLGVEIIPLVQCLGHLETPLSLRDYAPLRERPEEEDVLNPLAEGARELIAAMVDDVLALLPDVERFHLGGDEAWSFGSHPDTKAYIEEHGKGALYLHHVGPLLDQLNGRGIRPLLWHDMMREWDGPALQDLAKRADLVTWGYGEHPDRTKSHYATAVIERLVKHGVTCWGGTAYKGADGHSSDLPNPARRQANVDAWTEIAGRFDYPGVFVTAWSRYSTHLVQDEPIDGALDCALAAAVTLHDGVAPAGGTEACAAALTDLGEADRFNACQAALAKLTNVRNNGWGNVRKVRELLVCCLQDSRRRPSRILARFCDDLKRSVQQADEVTAELHAAFDGLMDRIWIERYLAERLQPLREELAVIEPQVALVQSEA